MPKTLVMITSYAPSLVDFRGRLIADLRAQGLRVIAFAPNVDDRTRAKLKELGAELVEIRLSRAGMNPLRDLHSLFDVYLKLRQIKPDFVLSYFIKPVVYGTIAAWLARVPVRLAMIEGLGYIFTYPADQLSPKRRLLKSVVGQMYRFSLSLASKVLFLNPDDRAEFAALGYVQKQKTFCLGGIGIDLNKWQPTPLPSGSVSFLMVARLLKEKGIAEYAQAAALVKKTHPHAQFVLLGGLDENPGSITEAQVVEWHDSGVLSWHGHKPVAEYMNATSVYVLPSYREGVPVSTMEAMAMGRPILTTDVPGCRETVVNGLNGFMVPARDAEKLAEKMIWFVDHADKIPVMGQASRRMAEEKFDVRTINQKLIKILLNSQE